MVALLYGFPRVCGVISREQDMVWEAVERFQSHVW